MDEGIRGALRKGDIDEAFRLLARAHGQAIYGRCLQILRNRGAAEDAMQQVLMAAFQSRAQLLEVVQLRGWLLTIAMRKCFDALRSSRRGMRLQRDWPEDDPSERSLERELMTAQERRALEGCLAQLDPEVAAALLMRFRDSKSWEEIADAVDLPLDTIRMRVQRGALKSLRDCLAAQEITS